MAIFNASIRALANKPANQITDLEASTALEAILADPRTVRATIAPGRDSSGRVILDVMIADTQCGHTEGRLPLGRVINEMSETFMEHQRRIGVYRTREDLELKLAQSRRAEAIAAAEQAEREANAAEFRARGYTLDKLNQGLRAISSGRYISDNDAAAFDFVVSKTGGSMHHGDIARKFGTL